MGPFFALSSHTKGWSPASALQKAATRGCLADVLGLTIYPSVRTLGRGLLPLQTPLPEEIITSCLISLLLTAVWTWTPCPSLQLPSFSSCLHATPSPRINFLPTYTHHWVRYKPRQDSDPKTWEFKIRFCLFEHAAIQDTETATGLLEPCVNHFTV